MTLPGHVKIGHLVYRVIEGGMEWSRRENAWGHISYEESTIRIAVKGRTPQSIAECLLHEIIHAAIYHAGLEGRKLGEEAICTVLSRGLSGIIADNPHLTAWLDRALAGVSDRKGGEADIDVLNATFVDEPAGCP